MRAAACLLSLFLTAACGRGGARPETPARSDSAAVRPDSAAADSEVVTERLAPYGDTIVLTMRGEPRFGSRRALVNGREVWAEAVQSVEVYALLHPEDGATLVVLAVTPGGTACDRLFRVLELGREGPRVTEEFGTCDGAPRVRFAGRRLRMWFAGWLPMRVAIVDTLPDQVAWPANELLEYRDGRMVLVASGRRADRLVGP
ncbi:MAG TPA: hypothetical protein VF092_00610 [Longimicrobium sp.]